MGLTVNNGWIGVDLDGTLAGYDGLVSEHHIGPPVPLMVEKVKQALALGIKVKIFTARVYGRDGHALAQIVGIILRWCEEHLGQKLDITCTKDFHMIELWDDRCVAVEPNTGRFLNPSRILV